MRGRRGELALLFLAAGVLLFALVRTNHAISLLEISPAESAASSSAAPLLPGEEILAEAERRDRMIEVWGAAPPERDPFRIPPPPRERAEEPPGPSIPRPVLVVEEEGTEKVVLSIGQRRSPPLAPGDSFRGWRVVALGGGRVLVEREGVLYTLPLP